MRAMFRSIIRTAPHAGITAPPAPKDFDAEEFFKGITWYQRWEVFAGIFTPGINPVAKICDLISLPADLTGRRVLDIGSANGCMSLECERRGAAEVIGITPLDTPEWGHRKLAGAVGSTKTKFLRASVYNLDPVQLGYFDTVLFCGVLYHLRYPMLGIDNIRRIATGDIFIETHVSDSGFSPQENKVPLWKFYPDRELAGDASNWFGPNGLAVIKAFDSAGVTVNLLNSEGMRAAFHGVVRDGLPEFMSMDHGESDSENSLSERLLGRKDAWRRPITNSRDEAV